jgi:hypothetical protein
VIYVVRATAGGVSGLPLAMATAASQPMTWRFQFAVLKLDLDPWEQIFHGEFDGRRRKRRPAKIISD